MDPYQGMSVLNAAPLSLCEEQEALIQDPDYSVLYCLNIFNTTSEPFTVCYNNAHSEL